MGKEETVRKIIADLKDGTIGENDAKRMTAYLQQNPGIKKEFYNPLADAVQNAYLANVQRGAFGDLSIYKPLLDVLGIALELPPDVLKSITFLTSNISLGLATELNMKLGRLADGTPTPTIISTIRDTLARKISTTTLTDELALLYFRYKFLIIRIIHAVSERNVDKDEVLKQLFSGRLRLS